MAITSGSASNKHDRIIADHQNDWISSGNGNDIVDGGAGNDYLAGGNGEDLLLGGLGNDIVGGGNGKDRIYGGGGNDLIGVTLSLHPLGENGNDTLYGDGYDTFRVIGGVIVLGSLDSSGHFVGGATTQVRGHDTIHGGNGADIIYGDSGDNADAGGNDLLFGAGGNDVIHGEGGDDIIVGGAGADVLSGGSGGDLFVYDAHTKSSDSRAGAMDRITDFQPGADRIDLRALLGGYNLLTGADAHELAWGGTTPTARGVWYEHAGGNTLIHADVNGTANAAELVIRLDGIHALQASDFLGVAGAAHSAPVNSLPAAASTDEDTALSFSAANMNAFAVADADGDTLTVALTASHGALALASTAGVSVIDGDGADGTLSLGGAAAAINAVLAAGLTYTPAADYSGAAGIDVATSDGTQTVTGTVALNVHPLADAPVLTLAPAAGDPDSAIPLSISAAASDTDGSETLSIAISGVPGGALLNKGVEQAGVWILTPDELEGLTLTPPPGASGLITLTVAVTSTEGGTSASTQATLAVTVYGEQVGHAIDGYIVGATVFADADGDGTLDAGEAHTTTGSNGFFTIFGGSGELVLTGGTDISTGLPFAGTLRAPAGSAVVTPLTTLIAAVMEAAPGTSAEAAQVQVEAALGLPDVDLTAFDPVQAALAGDPAGLSVYAAGVQVQNTIALAASLIDGAGATGFDNAAAAVVSALAEAIAAGGGVVDLGDAATAEDLIVASAAAAGVSGANIDNTAAGAAAVVAAINGNVAQAASGAGAPALTAIAQTAIVAQNTETGAAAALADAGASGDAAATMADFTGANLDQALADAADDVGVVGGTIFGTPGNDTYTGGGGADAYDGLGGNDTVFGRDGNDYLFGGDGNDTLRGEGGDDELRGGAGDDTLIGAGGSDLLDGGVTPGIAPGFTGDIDITSYSLVSAAVRVNLAPTFNATYGIAANTAVGASSSDTLIDIEAVIGSAFDDIIVGGGNPNFERLDGRGGNDTLVGGGASLSEAFYIASPAAARVNLGATPYTAGGITIDPGTAQDGHGGIDTLIAITAARGGAFDDIIVGNAGVNRLRGEGGNDILVGGDGDDRLFGGAGNDTLNGGAGADLIDGGPGTDTLDRSGAAVGQVVDLTSGIAGADTIVSMENVIGSAHDDTIRGNFQANRLEGGAGNDTYRLIGYTESDTIIDSAGTADRLEIVGTELIDIVEVSWSGSGAITAFTGSTFNGTTFSGIEEVTLDLLGHESAGDQLSYAGVTANVSVILGGAASGFTGAILGVENVVGGSGDDMIVGDAANNHLQGGAGNDWIKSGDGNDIIDGGEGIDTLDLSDDFGAHHIDLHDAFLPTAFDLVFNVENIIGSNGDDRFAGSFEANIISGGGGNDLIEGDAGSDTLTGGSGSDTFRWSAGDEFNSQPGIVVDSISDFETGIGGDVLDFGEFLVGDHSGTPGNLETFFDFSFDGSSTIIDVSSQRFPGGPVDQQIVLAGVDLTNGGAFTETQVIQNLLTDGNLVVDF